MAAKYPRNRELFERIGPPGTPVLLAFSRGKDSIAAWLHLQAYFTVVPFYMYLVPGLSFVDESIAYYESFFGTRIFRVPAPAFHYWLNSFTFQAPERRPIIRRMGLPNHTYADCERVILEDVGLSPATWRATGIRMHDSPARRAQVKRYGPIIENNRKFYPIWHYRREDIARSIAHSRIKLPVDYMLWGRTFDGLDFRFISVLKEVYPADYQRIKAFFPLVDVDAWRYRYQRTGVYIHGQGKTIEKRPTRIRPTEPRPTGN